MLEAGRMSPRRECRESRGTFPPASESAMVYAHQLTIREQDREIERLRARIAELEAERSAA